MDVKMTIKVGDNALNGMFHDNTIALDVYQKLFDALLDGDDGNDFEISLFVEGKGQGCERRPEYTLM